MLIWVRLSVFPQGKSLFRYKLMSSILCWVSLGCWWFSFSESTINKCIFIIFKVCYGIGFSFRRKWPFSSSLYLKLQLISFNLTSHASFYSVFKIWPKLNLNKQKYNYTQSPSLSPASLHMVKFVQYILKKTITIKTNSQSFFLILESFHQSLQ